MKITLDVKFHDLVTSASASTDFGPILTLGVIVMSQQGAKYWKYQNNNSTTEFLA